MNDIDGGGDSVALIQNVCALELETTQREVLSFSLRAAA